ncbi:MAG: hypothetical protein U0L04_04630 [Bacteroidaceae bacterium]|nr:hypothetical protein [Bacteroidaceae bacterium]
MSILIKGMEMPKSCLECRLYNDPWCMARNRNQWRTAYNRPPNGERQNDCPLVPVPPHGRLIDADALIEAMARMVPWAIADPTANAFLDGLSAAYEAIQAAPNIIEEGE